MHLGIPALLDFYRQHHDEDALVLATIVAVEGSTYRKPGAMMLASRGGCHAGMISGGCLEGDLMHHAQDVFASGRVRTVTYDMHADDELVWGLGLGCDGVIHLQLQLLRREDGFGFLAALERSNGAGRASLVALDHEGNGAWRDSGGATALFGEKPDRARLAAEEAQGRGWPAPRFRAGAREGTVLIGFPPPTRVLVCGAGPDAIPLVRLLCDLDWRVWVADHRPAHIREDRFPPECRLHLSRPQDLAEHVDLNTLDAVVIMSHHLENDSAYLSHFRERATAYIGILGPRARRDRLCEQVGMDAARVHGPAGLDIAAELPEAIALSIVAEIHAELNGRDGQSLSRRA
jgi:xanthine/CO dehydrogenase XdhC/CoxF family maturation factor